MSTAQECHQMQCSATLISEDGTVNKIQEEEDSCYGDKRHETKTTSGFSAAFAFMLRLQCFFKLYCCNALVTERLPKDTEGQRPRIKH